MSRSCLVIGAGFTGLAAARDLARAGWRVTVLEADAHVGGLAGSFDTEGAPLDRFYHHWFTSDTHVMQLVAELRLSDEVRIEPSLTGVWFSNRVLRLSTPLDLLRFPALGLIDRLRLGWMTLKVRRIRNWRALEHVTAADWLRQLGGKKVFDVIWQPLLRGKFGDYADDVSAVWFWNKLKLRGGSRGRDGAERLAYVRGSFARVAEAMAEDITTHGGTLRTRSAVQSLRRTDDGEWIAKGDWGEVRADCVIATPAPALTADMIASWAPVEVLQSLRRIGYLANLCLVLELDRPLSDSYWINVNDPGFPFVGVIEHTNFQPAAEYGGRHFVYLSKYLSHDDPMYRMDDADLLDFALPHLQRMFPDLERSWVRAHHVWRARWAQPVVERGYEALIPPVDGPAPGLYLCSMAQIYPEDRGTNYAVREGRELAARLLSEAATDG